MIPVKFQTLIDGACAMCVSGHCIRSVEAEVLSRLSKDLRSSMVLSSDKGTVAVGIYSALISCHSLAVANPVIRGSLVVSVALAIRPTPSDSITKDALPPAQCI